MIETARLHLRPFTDGDRDWSAAQAADPVVMAHLGGPQTRGKSDDRISYMMAMQAERGHSFWVMETKADRTRIGICGLKIFDAEGAPLPGEIEIGWRLDPRSWGQGYAREAATASLDFAFGRLDAPRVVSITSQANKASWGLMERLGMTRRPDLDFQDPRFPDAPTIVYLIEAATWIR